MREHDRDGAWRRNSQSHQTDGATAPREAHPLDQRVARESSATVRSAQQRNTAETIAADCSRCIRAPSPSRCETTIGKNRMCIRSRSTCTSCAQKFLERSAIPHGRDGDAPSAVGPPISIQLRWADAGFLARRIAEPPVPNRAPGHSQNSEHVEGCSPSVMHLDRHHQQRRDGAAYLGRHQCDSECASAFMDGKPARNSDRGIWIGACFAHSKQKSRQQQRIKSGYQTCQRSERGPPQHDPREHSAWSNAVAQHAAGNFKCSVGDREYACHPAPARPGRCAALPEFVARPPRCIRGRDT